MSDNPGPGQAFHIFVQSCGAAITLLFVLVSILNIPGGQGGLPWLLFCGVIAVGYLVVFLWYRDGRAFAFVSITIGTALATAEWMSNEGEMEGLFQAAATFWLLACMIPIFIAARQRKQLGAIRKKLWGKP